MTPLSVAAEGRRHWSLAAQLRLDLAVALVLVLVLGVCGAAWRVALDYRDAIEVAYGTELRTTVQLAEAESALWQLRYALPRFMLGSPAEQQSIIAEQAQWYAIVEDRLDAYGRTARDLEERRALTGLRSAYQRYKQARPKFFALWAAGEKEQAIAWAALTTARFGAETVQAFATQIALQRSLAEREQTEVEQKKVRVALGLVTAITAALLGMLLVGYTHSVRMLRPIIALRTQARQLVREQFGESLGGSASNEVAALEESFQMMSDRLVAHTESLRRSRERLDFLLRATPAIIYSVRPDGDRAVKFISANVHAILGYEPEEFLRAPGFRLGLIHPDDRERFLAGRAALDSADTQACDYRCRHKDGSWRWMHDEFSLIRDATGVPHELVGYWIDITARVLAEQKRDRAQERLQLALGGGQLAVWDADAESGKVWLSEQWTEMLGAVPRETWTTIEELVALAHPDDRERLLHAVVAVMEGERAGYVEEHRVRRASGEWCWILSQGRVTERAANGRAARISGTNLDISARKRTEQELQRLTEQLTLSNRALEQASRMKTEFMANVTHELRTPLNGVIGFAELLRDELPGPLNAKQAAFVADILASGQQLLVLVEGILEMSRLEAAEAGLEREPVEIGAALAERVAAHRQAADARGIAMALELAPDVGRAELDPRSLRRMLDVLLDNAIEFNRQGGTVAVSARRARDALEISVADTGIGIAQADLAKLFKPFVQLDAGLARQHGGLGLGLALAQKLAQLHGGSIEVSSEPGQGSRFTLRFPLQERP